MTPLEELKQFAKDGYNQGRVFNDAHFEEDFGRFQKSKRIANKFLRKGELDEGLLINHVIILLNVFGKDITNTIFRLTLDDVQFSIIKAVLIFTRQYDFTISPDVFPNRIIVDVLKDISARYNLDSK